MSASMGKGRLEAFSDGVIAVAITIMVLELHTPDGYDLDALRPLFPRLLVYLLSFVNVGLFWNNHHHMLHATEKVDGRVLWANLHLLFWISLVPFVAAWLGEHYDRCLPAAAYGVVLLGAAIAYYLLEWAIVAADPQSRLGKAIGNERKGKLSIVLYAAAIPLAFVHPFIAVAIYAANAGIWFVPDRRIEAQLTRE